MRTEIIDRLGANQVVAYTGTAAPSAAMGAQVRKVRLIATSNCHYAISKAGTAATTSSAYLPLGIIEKVKVNPGEIISVIQNSAGGNLHITDLTD